MYLKGSARAAILVEAHRQASGWRDSKETGILNVFSKTRTSQGSQRAAGCASPSRRISAGTAGKRQEVQGEEEQWGFGFVAANKTI